MRERCAARRDQGHWRQDGEDRRAEEDQEPEPDHELRQRGEDEEDALRRVIDRAVTAHRAERAEDTASGMAISADASTSASDARPRSISSEPTDCGEVSDCPSDPVSTLPEPGERTGSSSG